jgi:RNA polymerase sigma factor (sigma-70 family)
LYRTSKNDCLNYLRGKKRFKKKLQEYLYLQDDQVVELETLESEVVKAIHAAVQSLPAQCRRVVEMLYYQGMKYSAIAIEMGIEEATVRAQKRRAMVLLREKLGNQEFWLILLLLCGGILQHIHW